MTRFFTFLLITLSMASQAIGGELSDRPWVPEASSFGPAVVGLTASGGVIAASESLTATLHRGAQPSYGMNPLKGAVTEDLMDESITKGILRSTGKWVSGTPARTGNQGIDGIFFRTDRYGNIRSLYVVEAKYGSSHLGNTLSGKQMSQEWTSPRLRQTGQMYADLARELRPGNVSRATGLEKIQASVKVSVPLADGKSAVVWQSDDGLKFFSADKSVTWQYVRRQLTRVSQYLGGTADGRIGYRPGIFRYTSVGDEHRIVVSGWDAKTQTFLQREAVQGTYGSLPRAWQDGIRRTFLKQFMDMGYSGAEARVLARKAWEHPQFFKTMVMKPRYTVVAGIDRFTLFTAGAGGILIGAVDVGIQLLTTGKVDWRQSARIAALGAGSGAAGYFAGSQVNALLQGTPAGRKILSSLATRNVGSPVQASGAGALAGGVVATAIFSYGAYSLGLIDLQTAHRQFATGVAGVIAGTAFSFVTMTSVAAFGTASSGTAISSLAGAAATKATLAWLGGGAVSVGGGGTTLGTIVLTGGTAVVMVATTAVVTYVIYLRDLAKQEELIRGRAKIVMDAVQNRSLVEWQSKSPATSN
jgi:hypothetical protein